MIIVEGFQNKTVEFKAQMCESDKIIMSVLFKHLKNFSLTVNICNEA